MKLRLTNIVDLFLIPKTERGENLILMATASSIAILIHFLL